LSASRVEEAAIRDRSARRRGLVLALAVALAACGAGDAPAPAVEVDEAEADRLRELGYVDVAPAEAAALPVGVLEADPARMEPGLTYFTNAMGCSSQLVDAGGRVVRTWSLEPCGLWGNSVLLPDGSVLALHRATRSEPDAEAVEPGELVKLDWQGRVLWRRALPAHHDVEALADGRIATLFSALRILPAVDPEVPVRDHSIAVLSPQGEVLGEQSIGDLLLRAPGFPLRMRRARKQDDAMQIDLLHANSIEWMHRPELAARDPLFALSNVVICLRHQDAVLVVDWDRRRIVWSWGQGVLSGPHDATVLQSGNILIFDNGLNRRWSRVLEVDPRAKRVVWEYRAPEPRDFFTVHRGAAQRLANGNTLVTDSNAGMIFEVTPAGERVWSFRNPTRAPKGEPIVIVRARRVRALDAERPAFERSD
jgi:hypothetical protein